MSNEKTTSTIWSPEYTTRNIELPKLENDENYTAEGLLIRFLGDAIAPQDAMNLRRVLEVASALVAEEEEARQNAIIAIQEQLTGNIPIEGSAFSPVSWHAQIITSSIAIPDNQNGWSFGPEVRIAEGQVVVVGENSFWTIAEGELVS